MMTQAMKYNAVKINNDYQEALQISGLPYKTADGDALMTIIEERYKSADKQDEVFKYIVNHIWKINYARTEKK